MAQIDILLPCLPSSGFSGGIYTICQYANGLSDLGHDVQVISMSNGGRPTWMDCRFKISIPNQQLNGYKGKIFWLAKVISAFARRDLKGINSLVTTWQTQCNSSPIIAQANCVLEVRNRFRSSADITIATSYETALPVWLYGASRKFYFCQHYEPYFSQENPEPSLAEQHAKSTYHLPELNLIANSSWLAAKLELETKKTDIPICLNSIDHNSFFKDSTHQPPSDRLTIISYGGRNAVWKGIKDAAETIRELRRGMNVEWRVFGGSLLPPRNEIADYTPLGFLNGASLRKAYNEAHALLALSWYESFPLFPLESMACGTCVVTTPYGVEDYAYDMENCLIVPPRDPIAAANAIVKLARNPDLREKLSANAIIKAKSIQWNDSILQMEKFITSN